MAEATRSPAACTASASASSTRCLLDARRVGTRRACLGPGVRARQAERARPEDRPAGLATRNDDRFLADPDVFETTDYSFDTISERLRESAYLTKGIWITLVDERNDRERSFYFEGGLQSFVRHMNRNKEALHSKPIYVERREGGTAVEVALQYNDSYTENVLAFANNINTVDGGTHVTGFRAALTSSLERLGPPRRRAQGSRTATSPATTSGKA